MTTVIGQGTIEVTADARKLGAGIADAKRSIKGLGDANTDASAKSAAAIDRYIKRLEVQNATLGKSTREAELLKLGLKGASDAQLKAADSALKLSESHTKGIENGEKLKSTLLGIGAAVVTGLIAAYVAFDNLVKKAGDFQDMAEKTGDSAENIASLAVAAATAGASMEDVVTAANKLTKNLTGVDDESSAAGAAVKALGLNLADFKKLKSADQIETVGKALNGFQDGASKSAIAMALFGKAGAELLPFLKEIGAEGGRQKILTEEQIKLADDYADAQAKQRAELLLHAEAIATKAIPALNSFKATLTEIASDQEFAATASAILKGALQVGIVVFQAIAIVAAEVGFKMYSLGLTIGGVAAALNALAHLDFKGFKAISQAVEEDIDAARNSLNKFEERILNIGKPKDGKPGAEGTGGGPKAPPETDDRKKLVFNGDNKKDTEKEKARLAADLDLIKQNSDAILAVYSNAEKILEARRGANLIDDKAYYDAKAGFLSLNSAEQEKELQKEIGRLQKEKFVGKDKIENDQKITAAQSKLAQVRANVTTEIELNSIRETAAAKKVAQGYVEATIAAQHYIDTINKQNSRELQGIGQGSQAREEAAGRDAIKDKRDQQQQALEADLRTGQKTKDQFDVYLGIVNDTYAAEVEAYDKRTAALKEKQADWMNGANEAFANYKTNAQNVAAQSEEAFKNAYDGITDGIASSVSKSIVYGDSLKDGLKNVALSIADSFITAFIKIQIQKLFTDKVAASAFAGTVATQAQAMVAMAGLNAFASTAAIPYVGPFLAPEAAAGAIAAAELFAGAATAAATLSIASAEGGFDIPSGVNPITQLHEKEMVLPAEHADVIRGMAKAGGGNGNGDLKLTMVNNGTPQRIVQSQKVSDEEWSLIVEDAVKATANAFSDPNSKTSKAVGHNFQVQRSR